MADKLKFKEYMDLALIGIEQCKELFPKIIKIAYHEAGGDCAHAIVYSCLAEALRECIDAMSDAMSEAMSDAISEVAQRSTALYEKQETKKGGEK